MRRTLAALLIFAPASFGYIRLTDSAGNPLIRSDNAGIQFFLNDGVIAGAQSSASGSDVTVITAGSNPQQAIHAALATWNGIGATLAAIHFLPLKSTNSVINSGDYQMTIAIGSTQSDISVLNGALAVTVNSSVAQPANLVNGQLQDCSSNCQYPAGGIVDSDIIINPNPPFPFSTIGEANTIDFQSVMTHEFGHSLGSNHTGLIGAMMFQTVYKNNTPVERTPSTDELAFAEVVYPSTTNPATLGTIGGTVTSGGSPVSYALLTLTDTSTGNAIGGFAGANGTFSMVVPSARYQVYAEPVTQVVRIGNLYLSGNVSSFQPTLLSTPVNVGIGATATANISVNGGSSTFGVPFVGVTSAGGPASGVDFYPGGPVFIPSGGSVDLLLAGTGFSSSLSASNFNVIGPGITVSAVRADPGGATVSGSPVIRVTLNVTAQQFPSLASVFITNGSNTFSMSGALVVGPPTPVFTSKGVLSAASGLGNGNGDGAVSPGEYTTVYGSPGLGPTGGLVFGGFPNAGYDPYSFLAPNLAGVSVTFDGIPAPIFYVNGNVPGSSPAYGQINLQVPFEVAGKTSTQVVVNYLGSASAPITVPVLASHPAFFTVGYTNAAYLANADGSVNTASNPAARGSTITVYGTGAGVLASQGYPLVTGGSAPVPPSFSPNGFRCSVGGQDATVSYAGWTPTSVALAQWNIVIPASLTTTGAVSLVCNDGSASTQSTQSNLTVFVD